MSMTCTKNHVLKDRRTSSSSQARCRERLPVRWVSLTLVATTFGILAVGVAAIEPVQKNKENAVERQLRSEVKERDQEIQKLKKELNERHAEIQKLKNEVDALKKKPVVPADNIGLSAYDAHRLFAKETPSGTGPAVFDFKKAATLLLVWKHSGGSSSGGDKVSTLTIPDSD